jgi:prepilin signal peptidase PulO-like enzyme (type II secretory pathway)
MSIVFPASHCPTCKHPIALKDNIPVFSYLWLRGKCRYCAAAIPVRVPFVEAGTALLFALVVARLDLSIEAGVILVSVGFFLVIAIIDFDTRLIPNVLVGPGLIVALMLFPLGPGSEWSIGEAYIRTVVGALSGFGLLLAVYLVGPVSWKRNEGRRREASSTHRRGHGVSCHVRGSAAGIYWRGSHFCLPDFGPQTVKERCLTLRPVPGRRSYSNAAY